MDSQVGVEVFSDIADINSLYEEALANLRDRVPVQSADQKNRARMDAEKEQAAKDYYASVRTNVLLAWVLSNVSYWTMVCFICAVSCCFRGYCYWQSLVVFLRRVHLIGMLVSIGRKGT